MKKYEMQIVAICEKTGTVYAEHETAAKEMIQKMYRETNALDFVPEDVVDIAFSRKKEKEHNHSDYVQVHIEADGENSERMDVLDIEWI